jgi:MinD-like ATPase involved in chromosome partitioning or flagellar assembly
MAGPVTVLSAVRGAAETDVVLALGAPGAGTVVTRRCGDLAELLAAAAAGAGTVAVVSGDLPGLDREAVARLHGAGVRVVALADAVPADRLHALGADVVLDGGRPADDAVVAAVQQAAGAATPAERDRPVRGPDPACAVAVGDGDGAAAPEPAPPGRVVVVWGPVGAPGRTTTALELAHELAGAAPAGRGRRGSRRAAAPEPPADARPVLLVDADTYGSSLAARLGLLDDAPGLAAVARAAGQGALDLATLARHAPLVAPRLRVLTGLTRAARWPEVPGSALEVVLARARELAAWTVVDTGAVLEADELLMYDTHAPQRNAATLAALAAADDVVVVGGGDPVGVQRLVRGLEDLREVPVPVPRPVAVVVNRVRAAAVGPRPEAAVRAAMERYAGIDDLVVVPDDPVACDGALLAGRSLAEHAPASPARQAFAALADRLRRPVPRETVPA